MLKDFSLEKYDIIIQGGQSNSEGSGHGDVTKFYVPNDTVWYLNHNLTISVAQECAIKNEIRSDFSLAFARDYIENGRLEEGRKLLIIRAAVSATGFADKRWGLTDDLFLQLMDMTKTALSLNPGNRIVAFLWHQGEKEANHGIDYDTHYNNLYNLVQAVRKEFGQMPFIAGDFVPLWKQEYSDICAPIIKAMRDVCGQIENAGFVETNGLQSNYERCGEDPNGNKDVIHFSRAALYELGDRYYDAYIKTV